MYKMFFPNKNIKTDSSDICSWSQYHSIEPMMWVRKNEFFAIRVRAETRNNSNITKPQLAILCNLSKNLLNILMFGNRR